MEYLYFFTLVVFLGAVLAFWAVRSARPGNLQAGRAPGAMPARGAGEARDIRFQREAGGGAASDCGLGNRMGDWVGALLETKRTVDDEDYRVRTNESLRALVEDRYARSPSVRANPRRGRVGAERAHFPADERTGPVRTPWGW